MKLSSWETINLGEFLTLKRGYDLPSTGVYKIVPLSTFCIAFFHRV